MARKPRIDVGGEIYHVINRANGRSQIFHDDQDYFHFEKILFEALQTHNALCMAYVVMPNHWHLLVKTFEDGELGRLMRRIAQVHTQHNHIRARSIGTGHLYQGRYKSHVIDSDNYFLGAIKYIERNPVRAMLCEAVEQWRWGSGYHRINGTQRAKLLDTDLPLPLPTNYAAWVNEPTSPVELDDVRIGLGASPVSMEMLSAHLPS